MKTFQPIALAGALAMTIGTATAAEIKPAVVFDMGGKFDKSFNQGVYNGIEKFRIHRVGGPEGQTQWLRDAGFAQVDCVEIARNLTRLSARKAG